ncbi:sugar phosphate nucleotidyltransferase [Geoglobus acetivorans]|uniref:NDP-sugar synthase n=1 Tax=Geoglobus acetivorans TaxID=565033 RepID=A0ABZ3H5K2_GEOAI|nr:NDP-sugar synthase [Geoglobus acetivorans]
MKAVIMAGGYATRLWPITKTKAKPLLPLGKKTIIDHIYEKIKPFGFDIIVSTNLRFRDDFEQWADDKDVELVIENTTKEEEKLGAVRALHEVTSTFDDEVLVIAGDNIFSFGLDDFITRYEEIKKPLIALYDVGDYDLARRYGIAILNGEKIVSFEEKPEKPKSTLAGIGIYALDRETKDMLGDYVRGERKDNLGDFISWLIDRREVYGFVFDNGNWYDVGNPDSYLGAMKVYLTHSVSEDVEIDRTSKIIEPVVIEEGVKIRRRSIIGPYAYIGRNCEIEASDISDSVIFDDVILRKTKVWRSIIDEKCEIRNLELSGSIIGGHAKIQRGE